MVVVEMREAAYNLVFELMDELKELGKKKRMVMCELEDAIYNCYEASKEDEEIEHEEDYEDEDKFDVNLRRARNMRRGLMRKMKMRDDDYEDEDDIKSHDHHYHSNMRRRNRMGQYV